MPARPETCRPRRHERVALRRMMRHRPPYEWVSPPEPTPYPGEFLRIDFTPEEKAATPAPVAASEPSTDSGPLPAKRPDLVIKSVKGDGTHVVKDPITGRFYNLGPEETFLLETLDGRRTADDVAREFERKFGSPLSAEDVADFVAMARSNDFLATEETAAVAARSRGRQSILFWRKSLVDPDRFLTRIEPWFRWAWTTPFVVVTSVLILTALAVAWSSRRDFIAHLPGALRWETVVLAWITVTIVTIGHEIAHGLTCKHYGGEVREIGLLFVFFTPCLFCNVSDAWLFRERWKRIWVTFAGGYFDFIVWAVGVLAWRALLPGTLPHHLAFVAMTVCGGRVFFNFNPLMKLDGYYLLSDAADVRNLQQRSRDAVFGRIRWLLWGAGRPDREDRGTFLLAYGLAAWAYSLFFLVIMIFALTKVGIAKWGLAGLAIPAVLATPSLRVLVGGLFAGEVRAMFRTRKVRATVWALLVGGGTATLCFVPMTQEAAGPFTVRPAVHVDVHAPVAGFLRELPLDEGDQVAAGGLLARIEIPDLETRLAQKKQEIEEISARIAQCQLELGDAADDVVRTKRLVETSAVSVVEYRNAVTRREICSAALDQSQARLAKAREEVTFLTSQQHLLDVRSPSGGLVMTARLREKRGQYVKEGDLICTIEDPTDLRAEIKLPEQDVAKVRPGQKVTFKARLLPFDILHGEVERAAPGAAALLPNETTTNVVVYCHLNSAEYSDLRPGMTGQARIQCGRAPIGRVLADRILRYLRTEIWW